MTLYAIDNGGEYSDYCIYFVETEWRHEVVEAVVAWANSDEDHYGEPMRIIGTADRYHWAGGTTTLEWLLRVEWCGSWQMIDRVAEGEFPPGVPTEFLLSVAHVWKHEKAIARLGG